MFSRRLTPDQLLAATPLLIIGCLVSLALGQAVADGSRAIAVRQPAITQNAANEALAPKATASPTASPTVTPSAPHVVSAIPAAVAAPAGHMDKDATPKQKPPAKGGHDEGHRKAHEKGHGKH